MEEIIENFKKQIMDNLDNIALAIYKGNDVCLKGNKDNFIRVLFYRPKNINKLYE